jgi:pilus assembly protein CpaE
VQPFSAGVVVPTATLRAGLEAVLRKMRGKVVLDLDHIGDVEVFARELRSHRLDVLLIECNDLRIPLDELVTRLKENSSFPLLIALSELARPELILSAMRAGFHEFLYPPFHDALQKTIAERVEARRPAGLGKKGLIVGVFSAKGGCGATTIACHLAREIARQSQFEVLLADFDFYSGMVQFLMKTKSAYTLADAFENLHRLDASYWNALVSNGTPRLEVITAPEPATMRVQPTPDQIIKILEFLRPQYDWTVLDLGREPGYSAMRILDELDQTLLVTTLDPPSFQRAVEILRKLEKLGLDPGRLRLIVNESPAGHCVPLATLEASLGWPVFATLQNESEALSEACSEGRLLNPSSRPNQQFAALARKLAGIAEPEQASLFRRKVTGWIRR